MKYVSFGNGERGFVASQIVLGTHKFGGFGCADADYQMPDELCWDILDCYVAHGGNLIDSANVYGRCHGGPNSYSEKLIGQWLKSRGMRDKVFISTKGGHHDCNCPEVSRVNAADIEYDICDSLKNLDVDCIDVYSLHRDNENVPVSEIIDVLNKYVKSGNLRVIGASNWRAARINEANRYAEQNGLVGFSFSQIGYSMAPIPSSKIGYDGAVCMDDEEYQAYLKNGLPVMAFSSQAGGFYYINFEKEDNEITGRYATPQNIARLHRLRKLCAERAVPPEAIVLAYLTSNKLKTLPLISADTVPMLEDMLRYADFVLTQDEISYIEGNDTAHAVL